MMDARPPPLMTEGLDCSVARITVKPRAPARPKEARDAPVMRRQRRLPDIAPLEHGPAPALHEHDGAITRLRRDTKDKVVAKKAFTLIELLVVVAIIGILASVGVYSFSNFTQGTN
jgi:prepilin-type N-terminal cleavage/methylation domain-containing protein